MIEIDDTARRAITNARALLDAMLAGGWDQVCVTGEEGDFFLARMPGLANPLLGGGPAAMAQAAPAVAPAAAVRQTISAPHVGTVTWLAPVGARLAAGEPVARLAVLDTTIDVPSLNFGTVAVHDARIDDLAEYATPLVTLTD